MIELQLATMNPLDTPTPCHHQPFVSTFHAKELKIWVSKLVLQKVSSLCLGTWGPPKACEGNPTISADLEAKDSNLEIDTPRPRPQTFAELASGVWVEGARIQKIQGSKKTWSNTKYGKMEAATFQQSCVDTEKFAPVLKITRIENHKFQIRLSMDLLCQDGFLYHDCISPFQQFQHLRCAVMPCILSNQEDSRSKSSNCE